MSTIGASISLLGDQNIQKQLKNVKNRPKSGFRDIYPSLLSAEAGLYIGVRGFHSRVMLSLGAMGLGSGQLEIFVFRPLNKKHQFS